MVRLHFYAGIFVAPFLVVAALTGLAYTLAPQLDQLVYSHELTVRQVTGTPHSLAEQVATARRVHPEGTVASVIPPAAPDATTKVVLAVPGLGDKPQSFLAGDEPGAFSGAEVSEVRAPLPDHSPSPESIGRSTPRFNGR